MPVQRVVRFCKKFDKLKAIRDGIAVGVDFIQENILCQGAGKSEQGGQKDAGKAEKGVLYNAHNQCVGIGRENTTRLDAPALTFDESFAAFPPYLQELSTEGRLTAYTHTEWL